MNTDPCLSVFIRTIKPKILREPAKDFPQRSSADVREM